MEGLLTTAKKAESKKELCCGSVRSSSSRHVATHSRSFERVRKQSDITAGGSNRNWCFFQTPSSAIICKLCYLVQMKAKIMQMKGEFMSTSRNKLGNSNRKRSPLSYPDLEALWKTWNLVLLPVREMFRNPDALQGTRTVTKPAQAGKST
jgi:hypothetical protein